LEPESADRSQRRELSQLGARRGSEREPAVCRRARHAGYTETPNSPECLPPPERRGRTPRPRPASRARHLRGAARCEIRRRLERDARRATPPSRHVRLAHTSRDRRPMRRRGRPVATPPPTARRSPARSGGKHLDSSAAALVAPASRAGIEPIGLLVEQDAEELRRVVLAQTGGW